MKCRRYSVNIETSLRSGITIRICKTFPVPWTKLDGTRHESVTNESSREPDESSTDYDTASTANVANALRKAKDAIGVLSPATSIKIE